MKKDGKNGRGYEKQPMIINKIRKFGWENVFKYEFLNGLTKEEAEFIEQEMIDSYGVLNEAFRLNQQAGGVGGTPTKKVREKMSLLHLGQNNPSYGKPISEGAKKAFQKYNETKKRKVRCLETGEIFSSIVEAAKAVDGLPGNLYFSLRNENTTAYGKQYRYVEEE